MKASEVVIARARDDVPHAASRWAGLVVAIVGSPTDPRTLVMWARLVGVSVGQLRTLCRLAGLTAKASLDFGRLLRAVAHDNGERWPLEEYLDVSDPRTIGSLLRRAGLVNGDVPADVLSFLRRQQLVCSLRLISAVERRIHREQRR
jgi:hypothetical protein